jgi:hypothetical protein
LTFDTTNKGNQGYQGVYFKWGSLVGISPAGVNYDDNTVLYVPYGYPSAPKWKERKRTEVKADTDIPAATENWTSWGNNTYTANDIPYVDQTYYINSGQGRNDTQVIGADCNTQARYQSLRGDICQYLSKTGAVSGNYRLPMSNEFGAPTASYYWNATNPTTVPIAGGWVKGTGSFDISYDAVGYPNGRADLFSSVREDNFVLGKNSHASNTIVFGFAKNIVMGNLTLPLSGSRNTSGILVSNGSNGPYWTGSVDDITRAYGLGFNGNYLWPDAHSNTGNAFSIRCVHN